MTKVMITKRLTLRQLELHDAEAIEKLAGEKEVADTTLNMPHPYPAGLASTFINARHEAAARGDGFSFAVTLTEGGGIPRSCGAACKQDSQYGRTGLLDW
ncbi:GNAT family N-acetyltransferase [Paenibacillus nasutitermitis]|uniref:N-acetyltransferase domain-containing protein n=1 Tax=Paenibacillus nasutitermitis TaxID=1652958 RepID=A0A916Z729_9BACL|nr:GNAT family N-acetyltransferase [Paenibacillus nasutitermitis]GGD79248.1 hypothetical protein GCM10010911_41640 [Paenibacillus nasutitermitis]